MVEIEDRQCAKCAYRHLPGNREPCCYCVNASHHMQRAARWADEQP